MGYLRLSLREKLHISLAIAKYETDEHECDKMSHLQKMIGKMAKEEVRTKCHLGK